VVGSLAYLQRHPEVKEPTPQPDVAKQSTPKLPEPKAGTESKPVSSVDKDITKSKVTPKTIEESKNPEPTGAGMLIYLLGAVGIVLVGGGIFAFTRKRKDLLNQKEVLIQKSQRDSEDKAAELAQKAHELEIEKLRLQEVKNEIEAKEVLAAQKAQILKDEAEKELAALRKKAEEELATARAMKEALMFKQQAGEELAKAESMKKIIEAEAKLSLEKQRNDEEFAREETLRRANEEKAQLELERQRALEVLAKQQALKEAEERKRKADEDYQRLKSETEIKLPLTAEPQLQKLRCGSCGNDLRIGAKFCHKCGSKAI
jgi:DNA repair exonuclease SbcCD ATPase subunit